MNAVDYLTSPGWPEQYSDSQECDWIIEVESDVEMIVEFNPADPFEVEAAASGQQCYDIVLIKIIQTDETTRICGNSYAHGFEDGNNIQAESRLQFYGSFEVKFKVRLYLQNCN